MDQGVESMRIEVQNVIGQGSDQLIAGDDDTSPRHQGRHDMELVLRQTDSLTFRGHKTPAVCIQAPFSEG